MLFGEIDFVGCSLASNKISLAVYLYTPKEIFSCRLVKSKVFTFW